MPPPPFVNGVHRRLTSSRPYDRKIAHGRGEVADAPHYTAPDPEAIVAWRLVGREASIADFGALTGEQADGVQRVLHPGDSIFIAPGEARAMRNDSGAAAAMIVTPPPAGT